MKRSQGYKLLLIGTILVLTPFTFTELLGINLDPVQTLINLSYTFGLLAIATAACIIYYKGKAKR